MIGGDDLSFFKKCTRSMYIYFDAATGVNAKRGLIYAYSSQP